MNNLSDVNMPEKRNCHYHNDYEINCDDCSWNACWDAFQPVIQSFEKRIAELEGRYSNPLVDRLEFEANEAVKRVIKNMEPDPRTFNEHIAYDCGYKDGYRDGVKAELADRLNTLENINKEPYPDSQLAKNDGLDKWFNGQNKTGD